MKYTIGWLISPMADVTASIIQGSVVGTAAYVINAADLNAVAANELVKFVNNTYIVVPASNIHTCQAETDSVQQWTITNNLKVNPSKYAEIVFRDITGGKLNFRHLQPYQTLSK